MKLSNIEALVRDLTIEVRRDDKSLDLMAARNKAYGMLTDDEMREYRNVRHNAACARSGMTPPGTDG